MPGYQLAACVVRAVCPALPDLQSYFTDTYSNGLGKFQKGDEPWIDLEDSMCTPLDQLYHGVLGKPLVVISRFSVVSIIIRTATCVFYLDTVFSCSSSLDSNFPHLLTE